MISFAHCQTQKEVDEKDRHASQTASPDSVFFAWYVTNTFHLHILGDMVCAVPSVLPGTRVAHQSLTSWRWRFTVAAPDIPVTVVDRQRKTNRTSLHERKSRNKTNRNKRKETRLQFYFHSAMFPKIWFLRFERRGLDKEQNSRQKSVRSTSACESPILLFLSLFSLCVFSSHSFFHSFHSTPSIRISYHPLFDTLWHSAVLALGTLWLLRMHHSLHRHPLYHPPQAQSAHRPSFPRPIWTELWLHRH